MSVEPKGGDRREVIQEAICEVNVKGIWQEYDRVKLREKETWDMMRMAERKPETRIRYVDPK